MVRLIEASYDSEEGLTLRFKPSRLMPESTRSHLLAANKELLLALRSALDEVIGKVEEQASEPRRPRKVVVKSDEASVAEETGQE